MRMRIAVLVALVTAVPAGADPTTQPAPPYVIVGTPGGPVYGGMRTLPPVCAAAPRACAGNWNPNTGAWEFPPGT